MCYVFFMEKLPNALRQIFATVGGLYDVHLSSNFKELSPHMVYALMSVLQGKLQRCQNEVMRHDMYGEGALELFARFEDVFVNEFTEQDFKRGEHKKKTFAECLTAVKWAYDKAQEKFPEDEQLQGLRNPFDFLKQHFETMHPECQAFTERHMKRGGFFPAKVLVNAIFPPKAQMMHAFMKQAQAGEGGFIVMRFNP